MAEIKVEPKRGMGWIWAVVAVIALALILWLLLAREDTDPVTTPATGAVIFETASPVST